MTRYVAGVDIGGTKCAVCIAATTDGRPDILGKRRFPTPPSPADALTQLVAELDGLRGELGASPAAIGISCGSPMDSRRGLVLSPPNLPGWDGVDVVSPLRDRFGVPANLQNDANAGALAEWRWGAGQGCQHMLFLTFGTGMGAGLILNGQLYVGASDMAGEVGHVRLADWGPVGYGKLGSFEGFCSGGGIAQLGQAYAQAELQMGRPATWCQSEADLPNVTAELVGRAAQAGDPLARRVFETVGRQLGQGLALLVDILNPERIIIGSIFGRQRALLEPVLWPILRAECLPHALGVCQIVPAGLGESVGDYASLAVAERVLL